MARSLPGTLPSVQNEREDLVEGGEEGAPEPAASITVEGQVHGPHGDAEGGVSQVYRKLWHGNARGGQGWTLGPSCLFS